MINLTDKMIKEALSNIAHFANTKDGYVQIETVLEFRKYMKKRIDIIPLDKLKYKLNN